MLLKRVSELTFLPQKRTTDSDFIKCSVIAACLPTMRPLLTHAKAHTSHAKSTSTKSSRDIKSASSGSKGGPLSPMWSPPPPSSPRNAPYQSLDEDFPDLENGDSSFEMNKWPQTRQNARFENMRHMQILHRTLDETGHFIRH